MVKIAGIDEAGRGPVLGPLVMAGATIDEKNVQQLVDIGVKDSKFLTSEKREELYPKILEIIDSHKIIVLSPAEIDSALLSTTSNLNWLEAETSAQILNHLQPERSILDCPSPNIPAYTQFVKKLLESEIDLVLEHNAERYPIVAAASILAKVTRDRLVTELKKEIGIDFGSGYMSDQKTKNFLDVYHKTHESVFRRSWNSYKIAAAKKEQKKLGDF